MQDATHPKIAALFPEFIYLASREIFAGVNSACIELNLNLHAVMCGDLGNPDPVIAMRNILYEIINPELYDGFIIPYSALGQHMPAGEFKSSIAHILKRPCVLLSADEHGHSCVMPDYSGGICELVRHLHAVHDVKRFVFLRGPENHIASNARQNGFDAARRKLGLEKLELHIFCEQFSTEVIPGFIDKIEYEKLIAPDTAIIGVSEDLVFSLIEKLQNRGYRVPSDVVICGSSGNSESRSFTPSVTTIENNLELLGYKAVHTLDRIIRTGEKPSVSYSPVQLITRKSCGCTAEDSADTVTIDGIISLGKRLLRREADGEGTVFDGSPAADRVHGEFTGTSERYFFTALEMSIQNMQSQINQKSEFVLFNHLNLFRQIGNDLISDFNLPDIFTRLKDRLGTHNCFLSTYTDTGSLTSELKLIQALSGDLTLDISAVDGCFPAEEFFPLHLSPAKRSTFIIEPLFHRDQKLGILAIDAGEGNVLVLEALSAQICGALNNRIQKEKISNLALHDLLTGLPNRRLFSDRLDLILSQCRRSKLTFSVMFIDLDNFKRINDEFGHEAGDELLVEVSRLINSCIRDGDTAARMGGDEFVLLLPEVQTAESTEIVAKRILLRFSETFSSSEKYSSVSPSIGISIFPFHGQTSIELLRNADEAMYQSKRLGKNRYTIYAGNEITN